MKNKTTAKHFEIFKKECEKWIEIFGLKDWEINFEHFDKINSCASCSSNMLDRSAILRLSPDWGEYEVSDNAVKRTAFHEVCELLLAGLVNIAHYRYSTNDEIIEHTHTVIRTLENVLWKDK